ncbi:MAG: flagellar motor protein MotB [Candidatus Omnitrophota bacterium]
MKSKFFTLTALAVLVAFSFTITGCAVNLYKQSPRSRKKILALQSKVDDLEKERRKEQKEFEEVKRQLEKKLKGQIDRKQVSLKMREGSLEIILSDDILFDSGKAELKRGALPVLDKVARVIKREVPEKDIGIRGHSDNVPITYSNWASNWELSTARATNVLHYLESKGIPAEKMSATGYGEHRPIASNATEEGRARNRRVEIVILPEYAEEYEEDVSEGAKESFVK